MRLLMTPARVKLSSDGSPVQVAWEASRQRLGAGRGRTVPPRAVVGVLDRWRYDGRWWEGQELHREYFLVELDGGTRAELFSEEGDWWIARVSD